MSSQVFFYIQLILAVFFAASFFLGSWGALRPSKLKLRHQNDTIRPPKIGPGSMRYTPRPSAKSYSNGTRSKESFGLEKEKSLNVMFLYNGHDWDAYEVLGVPAGSRPEKVFEAYERALMRGSSESKEFIEAAMAAIASHQKQ